MPDSLRTKKVYPSRLSRPAVVSPRVTDVVTPTSIYGEYKICSYAQLESRTPSIEELNILVGSLVKVDSFAITGSQIDPLTYSIYGIEMLQRDDYIYREFGTDVHVQDAGLPQQFNVHKTDNERCYGIVEVNNNRLAIPYKGVLLYLQRN